MRAVFLVLLTANLIFLAWAKWIDAPRDEAAQDSLARLPRLQLATESPPGSKPTSALPAPDTSVATSAPVSSAADSDPAATSDPSDTPTPPASAADPAVAAATADRISLRLAHPAATCTTIGPFNDIARAARAAGLLTQRGFRLQQRAEEGETIEGYWVFVGGMQSDADVGQVVASLEKSGFSDAHVMKNYSTNRRVSVGMFSTRERAEKRAAAVRKMGLQPEIGERTFPGTVYWVDVALTPGPGAKQLPPEYSFADIGHAKVGIQSQACPAGLRPVEPGTPERLPRDGDGVIRGLPRTTVASAPKVP